MQTSQLALLRASALLGGIAFTLGCPSPDTPCDDDRLGCDDNTSAFVLLDCSIDGDMTVVPGQGERTFAQLADGDALDLHYGSQGGRHIFAGFRLMGADMIASPLLRATFRFWGAYPLAEGETTPPAWCTAPPSSWTSDNEPPRCWSVEGERIAVLGARDPLRTNDAGDVEETGLLLQLFGGAPTLRLAVTIEDQCGRSAEAWVNVTE